MERRRLDRPDDYGNFTDKKITAGMRALMEAKINAAKKASCRCGIDPIGHAPLADMIREGTVFYECPRCHTKRCVIIYEDMRIEIEDLVKQPVSHAKPLNIIRMKQFQDKRAKDTVAKIKEGSG